MIIMSGGSECAGYSHPDETIADRLRSKLQLHTKKNVLVVNLCMNSYTLANEIQAYVHLAYHLKPDIVITHAGWNDAIYGFLVSKEFVKTGLIYNKWQEHWLEKLYGSVKVRPPENAFLNFDSSNEDWIVSSFWKQIAKYHAICAANGSKFLIGIQGYNKIVADNEMAPLHYAVHKVMRKISSTAPSHYHYLDFSSQNAIRYEDSIHTSQDSVTLISDIYAAYILKTYPELF